MKVVLDTNVVVSALLHQGPTRRIFELWQTQQLTPLASQAVLDEYVRVLHYPKFGYAPETIARILEENLLPWIEKCGDYRGKLPYPLGDKNDEPFLRAALTGKAEALVSGEIHLTALNGRYPFPIYSPRDLISKYPNKR
jgi:putative PIN family toxin of toxin-antitoxin system